MTRVGLGVNATLLVPDKENPYNLDLLFSVGGGPTEFSLGPSKGQKPLSLRKVVLQIAKMLDLEREVGSVAELSSSWPWSKIFEIEIQPQLTVEASNEPSVALVLDLYEEGKEESGVHLPGEGVPKWLTIKPNFTVYQLVVSYDKKRGIDVRALVEFEDQPTTTEIDLLEEQPPAKKELVSFPFPTPPPASPNLQVKYLGLGQRFGPELKPVSGSLLTELFDELEKTFTSNNPTTLLESLARYYQPNRDWFFGAHVIVRGWEVRAVLNDPALYGLEVASEEGQFSGLRVVILYQKLGNGVGVFYGELTMPTNYRTIQLGVVSLTIPTFKLWIYTNGDFKVSVGWPLGPNSIGVQVYVFTGGGGFYFAKLRSGDKPASGGRELLARGSEAVEEDSDYNPIIEFGLGAWFGVGRSFSAGPLSAELSLTIRGTFQGLLAWKAPSQTEPDKSSSISNPPDYYWFAASVGVVGVLQGKVDLKIVSLSILVRIEATAAIAFETGCGTEMVVSARVDAEASLRIVFITITVGFHVSVEQSFTLTGGRPAASINGPTKNIFNGMNDWAPAGVEALESSLLESARLAATAPEPAPLEPARMARAEEAGPTEIEVGFFLQPAAVYAGTKGANRGMAALVVSTEAPAPSKETPAPKSPFEELVDTLAEWLLHEFGTSERKWSAVAKALRQSPSELDWNSKLEAFVAASLRFTIHGIELKETPGEAKYAFLPMFEDLQMSWTGEEKPLIFAEKARTRPNYEEVVREYFAELALGGLGPDPTALAAAPAATGEEPPPTGPSITQFIFDDYFLTIARQLAEDLAAEEKEGGAGGQLPTAEQALNAGGLGSRYLLNGLRLPDPATTPEHVSREELPKLQIASGYALNGQQFAVDASKPKCEATLEVRPEPGPIGKESIAFAGAGKAATSSMPVKEVPAAPTPVWVGPEEGLGAAGATIALAAIPPAAPSDLWVGVRNRMPWQGSEEKTLPAVLPLPPEVAAASGERDLKLTVQKEPPPARKGESLPLRPALLIPIGAHRVDRLRSHDVKTDPDLGLGDNQAPEAESPYVPFVYRLDGTDDATRAQIAAALEAKALGAGVELSVLYNDEKAGYRSDQVDPKQVLLAKANLSTTSQPARLTAPLRLATLAEEELGPTAANSSQVSDFAQLLWELSVVQAGGFYLRYETRDGKGLPDTIFHAPGQVAEEKGEKPTGDSAELTLAITFPEGTPVSRWHNSLVVGLGEYDKALYVGLADTAGNPLQALHPSYPPGCVGFDGTWQNAHLLASDAGGALYTEEWVEQLYHQLQFKVAGEKAGTPVSFDPSLWSLGLSPVKKDPEEKGPSDRYRQVLPAYRFARGAGEEPNPYAAVGGTVELGFRIGDVFGNLLREEDEKEAEEPNHKGSLPLLYNDPLVGPGEWPGVRVAHRFVPGEKEKGPCLRLSFAFDPESIVKPGKGQEDPHAAEEQAKAALSRYATAISQLDDPRTKAVLSTSIPGLLGNLGAINAELRGYAEEIAKELAKAVQGGKAESLSRSLEWPIEPKQLAAAESDVMPVEVSLEMERPKELVYVGSDGKPVEKGISSSFPVAADLSPREKPSSGAGPDLLDEVAADVALLPYAEDFEEAFAGWDGANGTARLAARHDREDLAAAAPTPPLWVLRMTEGNPRAGIDVKFEEGKAAYFSLAPLSVELVNDKAQVPEYDENLKEKGQREETFTGIDLDQWGEAFLAAVDEVLSPAIGTAMAIAKSDAYEELMGAKAELAAALAKGVVPVFSGTDEEVVRGDAESAREVFEQSLLGKLASAFTVSTIVQVPATVSAHDEEGPGSPRLFGTISALEAENQASAEESVALSSPKLPLDNGQSRPFLTFMASATDPGKAANLDLELSWNARFVEHLLDHEREKYGYEPSEWLRFVREREHDPLDFQLGRLRIPVPSRRLPSTPMLEGQSATQVTPGAKGEKLSEFLTWKYESGVQLSELEAQDTLWLAVTYNRPLKSSPELSADADEDKPTLFQALAAFTVAWQVLRPHLQGLPDDSSSAAAEGAIAAFVKQARRVAGAWARHNDALQAEAVAPSVRIDRYALDFSNKAKSEIRVYAEVPSTESGEGDEKSIVWPQVNGKGPKSPEPAKDPPEPSGRWYVATYDFEAPPSGQAAKLKLEWTPLDVLSLQTGCCAGWLTRNADLSGGSNLPTNKAFVYKTPEVAYNNPVVPLIVAPKVSAASTGTLAETLEKALAPLARAGTGVSKQRLIKLWCDYEFTLVSDGSGEAIRSKNPILLADEIELQSDEKTGKNEATLKEICEELDRNCAAWFEYFRPSREEAKLLLAVVLLADLEGAKLPLVRVEDLELEVLPEWWPAK
ncbi:MAG TPA: hypothetical protein VFT79_11450 [Solirubrobacterales bacterium]|nr:hypothetical protein [Solirubrobacterales bacterium]